MSLRTLFRTVALAVALGAAACDDPTSPAVVADIEISPMPQTLARYFIDGKLSVVVAGTHGKTTTTSLLAWSLYDLGADPSFLVGGVPRNFPVSYRVGGGARSPAPRTVVRGTDRPVAATSPPPDGQAGTPFAPLRCP